MTVPKATTLHMIGNAHLDPVWLWQWPEGFQEAVATVRSALDRMNEFPDFLFTSSSAAIYDWIEQQNPAIFAEVQARVAEGRWQLCGGWWIQPDCNIPSSEAIVRQGLYGQRYFKAKFGASATIGYNVDSFGHAGSFPQLLRGMGMDSYIFMRPGPHEKDLPGPIFWWEANDGSRVLTYRIPEAYTAGRSLDELREHIIANAAAARPDYPNMMCFYGVGNHGGGPTIASLEAIAEWNDDVEFPLMFPSTPRIYLDGVLASGIEIPVVHDDLQHHASGCYSAHSGVKRWNRLAENLLISAEKWSSVTQQLFDRPYPADLTHAWKEVLFNQFHDILAGTSLEAAYDDARDSYGEAMAIARRRQTQALHAIAWQIDIPLRPETTPIVVYNPHTWPATATVELEIGNFNPESRQFALEDDQGNPTAVQLVTSLATVDHWRHRIAFTAELPPLGYRTYHALTPETAPEIATTLRATGTTIENEHLLLELDPILGTIARLVDKRTGVTIATGGGDGVVIDDPSDTWSHGIVRFDTEIARFTAKSVELFETGPVRAGLRVTSTYERSTLVQEFLLAAGSEQIEVRVTVDWHEQFKALKLLFPLNLEQTRSTYEIPYGIQERPEDGEENPGQAWIDMTGIVPGTDRVYGLSLLNDGKYSFHTLPGELALTVLRSPIYAHHDPYIPEANGHYSFMDQGIQRFTYVLAPHSGDWRAGGAIRRAAELNQRAVAMLETFHTGSLPQSRSFASIDAENIVLSALKQAEDGDALIARLYETTGVATECQLSLSAWHTDLDLTFTPWEIKTVRVPFDGSLPSEVTLIEW